MNKLVFPEASTALNFRVEGIYATPEQWKTTDDANPGLFTYTVRFFKFQVEKGKIFPRQLTKKELRQQQEKNKKGGKKQSKKQEGNAQEERLKKLEEEDDLKRQEQWNKLSEEDRSYRPFQDTYRSPQLKFDNANKTQKIKGKDCIIFQERITHDHGEWIYVFKTPVSSEQQLAKMRKAKPKTLNNINDLNPIIMKAWLDLSLLNSKDKKSVTQRCKLVQIERTPQTPQPNLQNTYVKVTFALDQPFIKSEDGVRGENLIVDPPVGQTVSDKIKVVSQLRDELRLALQSLAMEYSSMFWKELNIYQDFKNMNYFINKKNEINKRKQHFLYDFNVSGKYKILKDRIKKTIVHLCQKYFTQQMAGSKSFTGISCSIKDQFYSQIYNFLVAKYKQTLQELIFEKKENLKEVEVLSPAAQKQNVQKILSENLKENTLERISRKIQQYELVGNYKYGEIIFKKTIETEPANVEVKYLYSMYCIRNKLKTAEQILPFIEEYLSLNKDDQKVRFQYLLLLIASENAENYKKSWVLLREIIKINPNDPKNLLLASFLFKQYLNFQDIGQFWSCLSQRAILRVNKKIPENGKHKQAPIASQLPTIKSLPLYNQKLSDEEKDQVWIQLLNTFLALNLSNVVSKILPNIKAKNHSIFEVLTLTNMLAANQQEQFQQLSKSTYEKIQSEQILLLIVNYYFLKQSPQAEKYLKLLLVKVQGEKRLGVLLKMASYYLSTNALGNSRACILKYLQKKPINSGFSWRILGICQLNEGNYDIALECLRKANLSDIDSSQNWLWLAKIYAQQKKFIMCNQCLNQFEKTCDKQENKNQVYSSIKNLLASQRSEQLREQKFRLQLINRLSN